MSQVMDRSDLLALLREYWPEDLADEAVVKDHPTLGMIRRDRDPEVVGKYIHIPIQFGKTPSRSRRFGRAQANAAPSKYDAFDVTITSDYGVGQLSGLAVDLAKQGQVGILVDEVIRSTKGSLETLGDQMGMDVFRNHGGSRGKLGRIVSGSPPAATVYELEDLTDIYFFEVENVVQGGTTDGTSGALLAGSILITALDENKGQFTATGQITSLAAGDFLFGDGDFGLGPAGAQDWVPETVASNDDFFNVNRYQARARLAGVFLSADDNGWGFEEAFMQAKARERRGYAKVKFWAINPLDLANFEVFLNGKRRIVDDNDYSVGYDMIDAYGADLLFDPNCPLGETFGFADNSFKLYTLGDAPAMVDEDGLTMMRNGTANSADDSDYYYEFRTKARFQFGSPMPYGITRMRLPGAG